MSQSDPFRPYEFPTKTLVIAEMGGCGNGPFPEYISDRFYFKNTAFRIAEISPPPKGGIVSHFRYYPLEGFGGHETRTENMRHLKTFEPKTVSELKRYERLFRCENCFYWRLEIGGRMTWGKCQIDGRKTKWTNRCTTGEFQYSPFHLVDRGQPRK